jgi:hypothetical protein
MAPQMKAPPGWTDCNSAVALLYVLKTDKYSMLEDGTKIKFSEVINSTFTTDNNFLFPPPLWMFANQRVQCLRRSSQYLQETAPPVIHSFSVQWNLF